MKFAIIGCQHSHIKMFIDEMLKLGHEFIGIYDKDESYFLPKQYSEQYKVPLVENLDDLLQRGVEIVGNADRNDRKIDVIEWCEKHGIDVMTDKPIAIDMNGIVRLKKVVLNGKIKIGMMLTERFEPQQYTIKKMLEEGVLGDILDFTFLKPHKVSTNVRPGWFFEKSINGGLIIDILIHDIDIIRWFTGKEVTYSDALLVKNILPEYKDFYDVASASLIFGDSIPAVLKADWLMPQAFDLWGDGRVFVTSSKGRIEIRSAGDVLGNPGHFMMYTTHTQRASRYELMKPPVGLAEDFINQIKGKDYILQAEDIIKCNETVIKIDAAARKIRRI